MTTTLTLTSNKGRRVIAKAPSHSIAIGNITDGDNSPCPSDDVEEELYHLRLILGKRRLHTTIVSVPLTEHCTMNCIVLKDDNVEDRMRAKDVAFEFCKRADYLYVL